MTVDGYSHCGVSKYRPVEDVLAVMRGAGVERAVLCQHLGEYDNSYLAGVVSRHPQTFAAVCLVDPTGADASTELAKWHATESAFRAAHLAIQVHGAYGYSAEYGIERYFRNARAPIIYEGTTQIHKMMQAEHALGYRNLNGRDGDISPLASWGPALLAR